MQVPNWHCQSDIWLPTSANQLQIPKHDDLKKVQNELGPIALFPSSGTGGSAPKWVILSLKIWKRQTQALLNELNLGQFKNWANVLPTFHVGGFSNYLRATLAGGHIYHLEEKWNVNLFCDFLDFYKIEVVSLVPTQLYDLLQNQKRPPSNLKCVIIGGAMISDKLLEQAVAYEWPVLPTFGMTETGAFFAYRKQPSRGYQALSNYHVMISKDGSLGVRSPFLFCGYWIGQSWIKPELDSAGYWICPDKAEMLEDNTFKILGRSQADFIKIKGEGISLGILKKKIEDQTDFAWLYPWELLACPHDRDGYRLKIVYGGVDLEPAKLSAQKWNSVCCNFERIDLIIYPEKLWPRTAIGKIHLSELQHQVCQLDPCSFLS